MSLSLLTYPSGLGAQEPGCQDGPAALRAWPLEKQLGALEAQWEAWPPAPSSEAPRLPEILAQCRYLADSAAAATRAGRFPVSLGGDHSMAVGTWTGITEALDAREDFGLIWWDAHMDAHTGDTSHSGAYHGMPVAGLLGQGSLTLTRAPIINPKHLCMIGVRSFEPGEAALLQQLRVRVYFMDEVRKRGLAAVMAEALDYIVQHTQYFGVSLDLDAFDPRVAPGTGSLEPDGIFRDEGLAALTGIANHPQCRGLEIAEFDPHRDVEGRTRELVGEIIVASRE